MTLVREYQPTFVLGDGETKEFSYLFEEVSENFIKVIVKHSDDSTYTPVFSVDLDSHKVVFGESETAPLDTDVVCIYRNTPDLQDTPFRTLQGYDAKALENILSKIVAMIQELKANGFSTQILQGTPWQLDLLHPADDNASVVVDYNARILKKGLYFQIVSGNLQVSADGNNFIKMPKSADITEFRRLETVLEDLTVQYRLQYKVDGVWYNAESNAEATANEALQVAQDAKEIAQGAKDIADTFDDRLTQAEQDSSDAKSIAQTTSGNLTTHTSNTNNPHQVTKAQIGLGNVDNTSDLDKPVSTATQTALNGKQATISDLATIRSNAQAGKAASDTIATYGDIVTHDDAEFATAAQGAKADTAVQPNDVGNGTITITQGGTTKGTFTTNQGNNTTIDIDAGGGGGLPDQTGNAGKFLTTDGTDASWSDKPLANTATGLNGLGIKSGIGGECTGGWAVGIGYGFSSNSMYSIAIGYNANAGGERSIAIGSATQNSFAKRAVGIGGGARADHAIQLGSTDAAYTYNSDTNTFKVANANGNFEMLSADGTIPEARLADTTSATQGQVLTLDSNLDAVWADAGGGGSGLNVGDIFYTMRNDNELNGAVECDGATYNTTDFTGTESIGALLEAGKLDYVSLSAYSTAISTKGWCDKIGWDGIGNTVFRVPTLNAHIVQTNNIPVIGNGIAIGITNGSRAGGLTGSQTTSAPLLSDSDYYGATIRDGTRTNNGSGGVYGLVTDPTKSGIIADTTDTAQLRVMIQLATSATDQALETCTSVLADVAALKYDYVVAEQLPTAANNYTWYRKYKSGWVEQGGTWTGSWTVGNGSQSTQNITLPVAMQDGEYHPLLNFFNMIWIFYGTQNLTTTGFSVVAGGFNNSRKINKFNWRVSGMSAS